ncbi:hypothetical protein GpartN1_g6712.t1 [Galdieria partita]|uniref:DNA polymerase delta subunit 3 n=1 Tax=Galdieria partita TaxID=83374 RepID=A0A9C7UTC0_9RHOD|nr:hypothetical protein GpartN1_g6712.t1 [Galdieria partita]
MEETKSVIEAVVNGSDKVLTCKGLSLKASIPVQEAKYILESYWAKQPQRLNATFVYSGIDEQGNRKWVLKNDTSLQLKKVKTISRSIYSISRHKVSEPSLICSEDFQNDRMMTLSPADEKNVLRDNRFSSVQCNQVKHSSWSVVDEQDLPKGLNVDEESREPDCGLLNSFEQPKVEDENVKKKTKERPVYEEQVVDEEEAQITRRRRRKRTTHLTEEGSLESQKEESFESLLTSEKPSNRGHSNVEKENSGTVKAFCEKNKTMEVPKKKSVRTVSDSSGYWVTEVVEEDREPLNITVPFVKQELENEPVHIGVEQNYLFDGKKRKSSVAKQVSHSSQSQQASQKSIFSFFKKNTSL